MKTPVLRFIYLDDEEELSKVVSESLRDFGVEVDVFNSPQDAFKKMRDSGTSYDLALIDYRMPVMNGVEVVRKMADNDFYGISQTVLFTSDCGSLELKRDYSSANLQRFPIRQIFKSIVMDDSEILTLLNEIIERKKTDVA